MTDQNWTVKQSVGHSLMRATVHVYDSNQYTYPMSQFESNRTTMWILPDGYSSYERIAQFEYDDDTGEEEARFQQPAIQINFDFIWHGDSDSEPRGRFIFHNSMPPKSFVEPIVNKAREMIVANRILQGGKDWEFFNDAIVLCVLETTEWFVKVKNDIDWHPWHDDYDDGMKDFLYSQQEEENMRFNAVYGLLGFLNTNVYPFQMETIKPVYYTKQEEQIERSRLAR